MKKLLINRGLPGSGKTTLAAHLVCEYAAAGLAASIHSADSYFVCPCCMKYNFDRERLPAAHAWCQMKCGQAMERGVPVVIIDNTNTTARECRPYVLLAQKYGYEVEFIEPRTPWAFDVDELYRRNTHGVPREGLEAMLRRWVADMTVEKCLEDNHGTSTRPENASGGG